MGKEQNMAGQLAEPMSGASWLADGVKEIERLARAAMITEPKLIALPQERKGRYGIVLPGPAGKENPIQYKLAEPDWHNEELDDPQQLIAFIRSMDKRGVKAAEGAVYIGDQSITYVYSFEDRRNQATCPLIISKPWAWLSVEQKSLTQREIIRLLRITFDGCLPSDSNLIRMLRNIEFRDDGSGSGRIEPGKEALGMSIQRELKGVADFPEEFALTVNVYENVKQPVTVRVALEILTDTKRFEIIPFPSQIHNGVADTQEWLRTDIQSAGVPTFIGSAGV